jgi:hypothetical protein
LGPDFGQSWRNFATRKSAKLNATISFLAAAVE